MSTEQRLEMGAFEPCSQGRLGIPKAANEPCDDLDSREHSLTGPLPACMFGKGFLECQGRGSRHLPMAGGEAGASPAAKVESGWSGRGLPAVGGGCAWPDQWMRTS